jgi:hypothetical protein
LSTPLRVIATRLRSTRTEKLPDVAGVHPRFEAARPASMTAVIAIWTKSS